VSCAFAHSTVHGYFDGELDAVRATEFEHHLEGCAECQQSLANLESLRVRLQKADLYEHASESFRERVRRETLGKRSGINFPTVVRRWVLPSAAVFTAAAVLALAYFVIGPSIEMRQTSASIVDAHVRSLQPGHLIDMQSTDSHTVKPWFDGKLDFVPPVADFSQQGFELVGGRLDVIDGRRAAAVVYGRRKHYINLFVWPYDENESIPVSTGSRNGYNWVMWGAGKMRFCLVSDTSPDDLQELKKLIGG
jgi:anti-sigma factor RsiW